MFAKTVKYISFILLPLLVYGIIRLAKWKVSLPEEYLYRLNRFINKLKKKAEKLQEYKAVAILKKWVSRQFAAENWLVLSEAICFVLTIAGQMAGNGSGIFLLWNIPFLLYGIIRGKRKYAFSIPRLVIDGFGMAATIFLLVISCAAQGNPMKLTAGGGDFGQAIQNSFLMFLSWLLCFLVIEAVSLCMGRFQEKKEDEELIRPGAGIAISLLVIAGILILSVFAVTVERMGLQSEKTVWHIIYMYLTKPLHIFNIYIMLFLCGVLFFLFGAGTGTLLSVLFLLFIYIGNYIKLDFHNTFFTWLDTLQIKEMFMIGKEFVTLGIVALVLVIVAGIVAAVIIWRKAVGHFLRLRFCLLGTAASVLVLLFLCQMVYSGDLKTYGIYQRTWENEEVNVKENGLIVNLVYNLRILSEIRMDKPAGYSRELAEKVSDRFDKIGSFSVDDKEPNVILILDESLFDLDGVNGLTMSQDIDSTVDAHSTTSMISPRYGGYTSAMEFEALTGLSLAYMPNGLTPYTTYFNDPKEEFPCIVREFQKNGYQTVAMHPNLPDFYNRSTVYKSFGFDRYLAVEDFDLGQGRLTENGWLKDEFLGDDIIKQLESTDDPQFVFAITMEGHYVTVDKYKDTQIKVTAPGLPEEELHQVEQQAQSYYNADQMLAKLVNYMNTTKKPTLLYVFGDHLPPLKALGTLGYVYDVYNKYTTSLMLYSNYKNIDMGTEYVTPNQIAAQIMEDSGIEHSSYYDYIYSVRKDVPVLHKEFVDVENTKELDDYYFLQYDILMGKRYLYEK